MPSFRYGDTDVYYEMQGAGKPVLLVHGFGEDSSIWDLQVDALKNHCLIITLDLPGSGRTKPIAGSFSMEDYAELIHTLYNELGLNELILLGHSMGGYITLAYAEKYPQTLRAFGLIHSTAFADSEEKKQTRKKGIEFIRNNGAFSFLKTSTPNLFSAVSKSDHPEIIEDLIGKSRQFTDNALIQYYEAMILRPDRTTVLKSSERPVLFILGTEDTAAPMTDVLHQVHLPQTAYVQILENVGHMSMLEAPDLLNRHLQQFINEV